MQEEQKDKDSECESLVFWVFLHDSVNQALGKSAVCMKSHCNRAFTCVKKPFRKTKKHALLMSFKRILQARQVMIRHPKGENTISLLFHSPLIIPRVPVTFEKIKCGRGSGKDFISLQIPVQGLTKKKCIFKNALND